MCEWQKNCNCYQLLSAMRDRDSDSDGDIHIMKISHRKQKPTILGKSLPHTHTGCVGVSVCVCVYVLLVSVPAQNVLTCPRCACLLLLGLEMLNEIFLLQLTPENLACG